MGDASASGYRSVTAPPTIASSVAKPQSAPVKSWIDRTSTQPHSHTRHRGPRKLQQQSRCVGRSTYVCYAPATTTRGARPLRRGRRRCPAR